MEALAKAQEREHLLRTAVRDEHRFVVRGQQERKPAGARHAPSAESLHARGHGPEFVVRGQQERGRAGAPEPQHKLVVRGQQTAYQIYTKHSKATNPKAARGRRCSTRRDGVLRKRHGNPQDALDGHGHPRQLPHDDAFHVVTHLHLKMKPTVFAESARLRLGILRDQHPDAYNALLQKLTQQEQGA